MAGLQLGGLVSGLDTDTVIQQLLAVDGQAKTRLTWNQAAAQTRQNALRDVETRLKNLKLAADDLGSTLLWSPTQTADSGDPAKLGVRMSGGAAPGGYHVQVTQMATAAQQTFTWTPQATASTIDIGGVSVSIDAGADIDAAAATINANSQLGVYAINIGNGKLVLSSRTTGSDGDFTATGAALGAGPIASRPAQNAQLSINGVAQPDQQSNVVSNLIPGVELTLKSITDGTTISVSNPGIDRTALTTKLKAFVSAYNDVVDFVSDKLSEKRVTMPQNAGDAGKGVLFGDGGLQSVLSGLRSLVGDSVAGLPAAFSLLSQIGISTGAAAGASATSADSIKGRLTLDEAKLGGALDADPLSVQKLLGGVPGSPGFSQSLQQLLEPLVTSNGIFDQRVQSAGRDYTDIGDAIARLTDRLSAKETLLRKQFTAMEEAMQRNQAASASILAKLGG